MFFMLLNRYVNFMVSNKEKISEFSKLEHLRDYTNETVKLQTDQWSIYTTIRNNKG